MSIRLNPFAWALRWLDRRIDVRVAASDAGAGTLYINRPNALTGKREWKPWSDEKMPSGLPAADIEIDGERYFIRQIVGRPSVLVQARTSVEVPLPFAELAPARQRGSHAQ